MSSHFKSKSFMLSLAVNFSAILGFTIAISLLMTSLTPDRSDLASWVQAIGAIAAIVAGFAASAEQKRADQETETAAQRKSVAAAHMLAWIASQHVADRLNGAFTESSKTKNYALHGDRTTDVVRALTDVEISTIPSELLVDFVTVRSQLFAINNRLTEVYDSEDRLSEDERKQRKMERPGRLQSALRMRIAAAKAFMEMQGVAEVRFGVEHRVLTIGDALRDAERSASYS